MRLFLRVNRGMFGWDNECLPQRRTGSIHLGNHTLVGPYPFNPCTKFKANRIAYVSDILAIAFKPPFPFTNCASIGCFALHYQQQNQ